MKTLLAFSPSWTDATSFYRGFGPLGHLKRNFNFLLERGDEVNWARLSQVDSVFLQRPFTSSHVQVVNMAKANGKKVWVDYDDDLYSVPYGNRAYKYYSNKPTQNNLTNIIATADYVTVSTAQLKRKFSQILKSLKDQKLSDVNLDTNKIRVVPNAYNQDFCKYRQEIKEQKKLSVWRGSDTHDKDLLLFTGALKAVLERHPKQVMNFVGQPFWYTIEQLCSVKDINPSSVVVTPPLDPAEYWLFLYKINPKLVFVPLWDCPFNQAKSNIAWIEGVHAGAACLAPDWEEWRKPGVITYTDTKDFAHKLDDVMAGEVDTMKLYEDGWEYIQENLTLQKVNKLRKQILEEMWS